MPKSTSRTRSRLLYAGMSAGAMTAALLAAPQPAFAADLLFTVSPGGGPTSGTLSVGATGLLTGITTPGAIVQVAACPTTAPGGGTTATAARVTDDKATITLPGGLGLNSGAPQTYNVCLYAATAATSAIAGHGTYTVVPGLSLNTASGPAGGGNTVTATVSGTTYPDAIGAAFSPGANSCPATYNGVGNVPATPVAKTSSTVANITVPAGVGPVTAVSPWSLCFYSGATATSTLFANAAYVSAPGVGVNPPNGPSGGGNTVTASANQPVFASSPQIRFAPGTCPATYGTPGALGATNVLKVGTANNQVSYNVPIGVAGTGNQPTPFSTCFYNGTDNTGTLIAISAGPYNVAVQPGALSSIIGAAGGVPNGGGGFTALPAVNLTISSPNNFLTGYSAPAGLVLAGNCPAVYTSSLTPSGVSAVRKIANNKATITLPTSAVVVGASPTPYNVCVYSSNDTTTGKLLTSSMYTTTNMPTVVRVIPDAGSALGGSMITVIGTNLPTAPGSINALLGGTPLINITPISDTTFTATTPMHPVGDDQALVVTTNAGSVNLSAAYDYTNAIVVTPNTAPNTVPAVDVDVTGVGFLPLAFPTSNTTASTSTDAHVYLVNGVYDPATAGADNDPTASNKSNGPVAECTAVLVISDNELICSLQLNHRLNPAGTFTLAASRQTNASVDGVTIAGSHVVDSPTGAFTSADIGTPLTGTGIPAGTTIVSITSPTRAVLSAPASASTGGSPVRFTIGGPLRTVTLGASSANNTLTITGGSGTSAFTSSDVGRPISCSGSSTTAGTMIVSVASNVATLSKPLIAAVTNATTCGVSAPAPVPAGAYNLTVVNHGDLSAHTAWGEDYMQSVVSSGSTFTVAPF